MSTTYSPNYLFIEPAVNDPTTTNQWGDLLNLDMTLIDSALAGELILNVSAGGNIVLTSIQGQPDQARNYSFTFTGALHGNTIVLWPQGLNRNFRVTNSTTGNNTLSIGADDGTGNPAGTLYVVPSGATSLLSSDGTNVAPTFNDGFLPLTGGTLTQTGGVSLALNTPTVANRSLLYQTNGVNRWSWVTGAAAEAGANSGSNIFLQSFTDAGAILSNVMGITRSTGVINLSAIPTFATATAGSSNTQAANTNYVDRAITTYNAFAQSTYFPIAGGTITGNTNIGDGANAITVGLKGGSGTNRNLVWLSGSSLRWNLLCNGVAESGGNAGSNLQLQAFDDSGALISGVFSTTRSAGTLSFTNTPALPTAPLGDNSTLAANTAFVTRAVNAIPSARAVNVVISPSGTNAFIRLARLVLVVPTGGYAYIITANVTQAFAAGTVNTQLKITLNGSDLNLALNVIQQTNVTIQVFQFLAAGTYNVDMNWLGANANVSIDNGTISCVPAT